MTTSWTRGPLRHLRFSGDNVKTLHKLSKWCLWRRQSVIIRLQLNDCRNPQSRCAVLLIPFTEEVGCILPSRLSQFIEPHLLPLKPLHVLLYRFGDCAHHPAGFSVSNGSRFVPGRFYRSAWQRPYPIKYGRFFKRTITLRPQILIREFSIWYV